MNITAKSSGAVKSHAVKLIARGSAPPVVHIVTIATHVSVPRLLVSR